MTLQTLPKYETYKNSGIEWLGEIPSHWTVNRIKADIELLTGYPFNSREYFTEGVKLTRGINVKEGRLDWKDTAYWSEITSELKKYVLCDGDILIGMDGSKVGKNFCQINVDDLPLLLLQRVARLRVKGNLVSRFLFWNIASVRFLDWVNTAKTDPMIPHIAPSDINGYVVSYPPIAEQTAIADFLDQKTAQIDAAIAIKKQQIALLKERKQILIQQAVTQGLDPTVPMKNSGVEWIGEIPAHWDLVKLRGLSNIVRGASPRPAGHPKFFADSGTHWITVGEVTKDTSVYLDDTRGFLTKIGSVQSRVIMSDTFVLTNSGATLGVPKITKVTACINDGILAFLNFKESRLNKIFLYYFFTSQTMRLRDEMNQGATQPNLNTSIVKNIKIPIPRLNEQLEIIKFLEKQSAKSDDAVMLQQQQIEKLREYKITLINSAVTGKIRVTPEMVTAPA